MLMSWSKSGRITIMALGFGVRNIPENISRKQSTGYCGTWDECVNMDAFFHGFAYIHAYKFLELSMAHYFHFAKHHYDFALPVEANVDAPESSQLRCPFKFSDYTRAAYSIL